MSTERGYRTLRGFVSGQEPDQQSYFAFSATLRIGGDNLDFGRIEAALATKPSHQHRKGDKHGPRSRPFPTDMWALDSGLSEDALLGDHLDALWQKIRGGQAFLRELKSQAKVDIFCGYRSNVDHAGFEVPSTSLEMFQALGVPFGVSVIIT